MLFSFHLPTTPFTGLYSKRPTWHSTQKFNIHHCHLWILKLLQVEGGRDYTCAITSQTSPLFPHSLDNYTDNRHECERGIVQAAPGDMLPITDMQRSSGYSESKTNCNHAHPKHNDHLHPDPCDRATISNKF